MDEFSQSKIHRGHKKITEYHESSHKRIQLYKDLDSFGHGNDIDTVKNEVHVEQRYLKFQNVVSLVQLNSVLQGNGCISDYNDCHLTLLFYSMTLPGKGMHLRSPEAACWSHITSTAEIHTQIHTISQTGMLH